MVERDRRLERVTRRPQAAARDLDAAELGRRLPRRELAVGPEPRASFLQRRQQQHAVFRLLRGLSTFDRKAKVQLDAIPSVHRQIDDLMVVLDLASQVEVGAVVPDQKLARAVRRAVPMSICLNELRTIQQLDRGRSAPLGEIAVHANSTDRDDQFP